MVQSADKTPRRFEHAHLRYSEERCRIWRLSPNILPLSASAPRSTPGEFPKLPRVTCDAAKVDKGLAEVCELFGMMPTPLPPPGPHPSRRPRRRNLFSERDLARAVRAAHRAGGVARIEISSDDGTITLLLGELPTPDGDDNPWDKVLTDAANEKRSA